MEIKWETVLIEKCYEVIPQGGEVRIQFSKRDSGKNKVVVPIIRIYPHNQIICKEVELID